MFLLLFAISAGSLFAQRGFNVSVALQPGVSMLGGDWKINNALGSMFTFKKSFTFGFAGGAIAGFNFTDNLGVSAGLFISSQGQKYSDLSVYSDGYGSVSVNQTIRLTYFKIPVKFIFTTDPTKSISLLGSAGFYLGFLTGYKQTVNVTGTGNYSDLTTTQVATGKTVTEGGTQYDLDSKPFKSTDFGITLGVGAQKKLMEKLFLFVMINFEQGFGDVKNVASVVKYSNGSTHLFYENDDPNRSVTHSNTLIGLMIGVKKTF